jgi:hypothetical protein
MALHTSGQSSAFSRAQDRSWRHHLRSISTKLETTMCQNGCAEKRDVMQIMWSLLTIHRFGDMLGGDRRSGVSFLAPLGPEPVSRSDSTQRCQLNHAHEE